MIQPKMEGIEIPIHEGGLFHFIGGNQTPKDGRGRRIVTHIVALVLEHNGREGFRVAKDEGRSYNAWGP